MNQDNDLKILRTYDGNVLYREEYTNRTTRQITRSDGPAVIIYNKSGEVVSEQWYLNGVRQSFNDKPAIITRDDNDVSKIVVLQWFKDGVLHRDSGPASIQYLDEDIEEIRYMQEGKLNSIDNDQPARIIRNSVTKKHIREEWYHEGLRHRDFNEPARIIYSEITGEEIIREWWINGERLTHHNFISISKTGDNKQVVITARIKNMVRGEITVIPDSNFIQIKRGASINVCLNYISSLFFKDIVFGEKFTKIILEEETDTIPEEIDVDELISFFFQNSYTYNEIQIAFDYPGIVSSDLELGRNYILHKPTGYRMGFAIEISKQVYITEYNGSLHILVKSLMNEDFEDIETPLFRQGISWETVRENLWTDNSEPFSQICDKQFNDTTSLSIVRERVKSLKTECLKAEENQLDSDPEFRNSYVKDTVKTFSSLFNPYENDEYEGDEYIKILVPKNKPPVISWLENLILINPFMLNDGSYKFTFEGQSGIDAGGLTSQYFTLLGPSIRDVFFKVLGLGDRYYVTDASDSEIMAKLSGMGLQISGGDETEFINAVYEEIGRLILNSLINNYTLEIPLSRVIGHVFTDLEGELKWELPTYYALEEGGKCFSDSLYNKSGGVSDSDLLKSYIYTYPEIIEKLNIPEDDWETWVDNLDLKNKEKLSEVIVNTWVDRSMSTYMKHAHRIQRMALGFSLARDALSAAGIKSHELLGILYKEKFTRRELEKWVDRMYAEVENEYTKRFREVVKNHPIEDADFFKSLLFFWSGTRNINDDVRYNLTTTSSGYFLAHTCSIQIDIPKIDNADKMKEVLVESIKLSGDYFGMA